MSPHDPFLCISPYYDHMMNHVNYDRWCSVVCLLHESLPAPARHLDVACGTGRLVAKLRRNGVVSFGVDRSHAMVQQARNSSSGEDSPMLTAHHHGVPPLCVGDARALPFAPAFHCLSCLFDSLNFLLTEEDIFKAFLEMKRVLLDPNLVYVDFVTERMVRDWYDQCAWTETVAGTTFEWASQYDARRRLAVLEVQTERGHTERYVERIYSKTALQRLLRRAGFHIVAWYDAQTGDPVTRHTHRMELVLTSTRSRRFIRGVRKALREKYPRLLYRVKDTWE